MPYRCLIVAALALAALPAIAQAGAADPIALSRADSGRAEAPREGCQPNVVHSHPGGQPSHYAIALPVAAGCAASGTAVETPTAIAAE